MQQYKKILGKVMMTAEGTYDSNKGYDPISLITDEETGKSYISRKEVPAGTQINNREYWQPVASSGIIDNGVIILNRKNSNGQVPIYDLKSATEAVAVGDRKGGVILGFLGFNPETDTVPTWKLYQYNDVSPSNWTNIDYWLPMDYTNKYAGWFDNEEALYDSVPFPKIGMYAYVGNSVSSAIIYRCYNDRVWYPTEDKAFSGVVNLADEEDITSKQNKLKFKDKEYNPAQYNGLGKLYLRKNMIDEKNILTQNMIQATNTIYIVQYDYDLQGETITIPENCILDFQGGSFNNGNVVGNNTSIQASLTKIFSIDIKLSGSWVIGDFNVEWFGAIGDGKTDSSQAIQNCIDFCSTKSAKIRFNGENYIINKSIKLKSYIEICGNSKRNTTITGKVDIFVWDSFIEEISVSNINFNGNDVTAFKGDSLTYISTFIISKCNFFLNLKRGFYGCAILGKIADCTFGYYGNVVSAEHSFIHFVGDAGNSGVNINKLENNKFYRSVGDYCCTFVGGYQLLIKGCTFEQNSNDIAAIKFEGMSIFNLYDNWIEHNHSPYFINLINYTGNQTVGNYVIKFANNYVYSSKECVEFIHNTGGSATSFLSIIYNEIVNLKDAVLTNFHNVENWISEHYGNRYLNSNNIPKDKLPVSLPFTSISTKGLIKDTWFQNWTTNDALWGKFAASTLSNYNEGTFPEPYNKGIKIQGGTSHNGIYIKLPYQLLKGKTLIIKALVKLAQTAGGNAWRIGYSYTDTPNSLNVIGDSVSMSSDSYIILKGSFTVNEDYNSLTVGLYTGGIISTLYVKAFDVWIAENINPEFSI